MNRPLGTWKLLILTIVFSAPIGYWLLSHPASNSSAVYAQQSADAQQARGGLDGASNVASADQLSKVFRDVSKSLKPSVVSIKNVVERSLRTSGRSNGRITGLPPEIEQLLRGQMGDIGFDDEESTTVPRGRFDNGLGSGVIIREDGYILTNNHVVEGASVLEVILSDDRKLEAKVIGTDPRTDLAVLKIEATGLVAARLGNSDNMEVGDWVIAIGSPFGLAQTVTAGIVSATNRNDQGITLYDSFIQTDAAINPGNSGGPLLNLRGEVIGINTAIASKSGGYNGICFAVPSSTAKRVLDDLISKGHVTRGVIGVTPLTLTPQMAEKLSLPSETKGALIASVARGLPASKAGLKEGDVITAINGNPIVSDSSMRRTIGETKPGTQVKLTYTREGRSSDVMIKVEELNEQQLAMTADEPVEVIGINVGPVSAEAREEYGLKPGQGVEVKGVNRKSPLSTMIPPGVVILSVNGMEIGSPAEFAQAVEVARRKGTIKLTIRDSEADKMVQIRL